MSENNVSKYPEHLEAINRFLQKGFSYGDLVTKDWLFEAFGLKKITSDMKFSEAQKIQFRFLSHFTAFQNILLEDHLMALDNVKGDGYRVVNPSDQTKWAHIEGVNEMKKTLNKMAYRTLNVNQTLLTEEQKRENTDALTRIGMLKTMVKEKTKISFYE